MATTDLSFAGVDPGRTGGLALISPGNVPKVWEMPKSEERGCDIMAVWDILSQWPSPVVAALEWNTSRPGEVPDFAFRFGLQTGQLHALLFAKGFQVKLLAPNKWKGRLGLPGKTDDPGSLQGAALWDRTYPPYKSLIRGPKGGIHDGPLDALLIALYLRKEATSGVGWKGGKRPPKYRGIPREWLEAIETESQLG